MHSSAVEHSKRGVISASLKTFLTTNLAYISIALIDVVIILNKWIRVISVVVRLQYGPSNCTGRLNLSQ